MNKTIALMYALIFVIAFILCGDLYAGPIDNADQFQKKAVKSVLRSSGNQNFRAKEEYIEGIDIPDEDNKNKKKDETESVVNTANVESGDTHQAGTKTYSY